MADLTPARRSLKKRRWVDFLAKNGKIRSTKQKPMIYLDLYTIGDLPKGGFSEIRNELLKPLQKYVKFEHRVLKSTDDLIDRIPANRFLIVLDEAGKTMDSKAFASKIKALEDSGSHIAVILGGAKGLSDELKQKADLRLSLSEMTTTHDLAHLFFLEQLYRACTINHGKEYHY